MRTLSNVRPSLSGSNDARHLARDAKAATNFWVAFGAGQNFENLRFSEFGSAARLTLWLIAASFRLSIHHVVFGGSEKEMGRSQTAVIIAAMQHMEAISDGPDVRLVRKTMNGLRATLVIKAAVRRFSLVSKRSGPFYAARNRIGWRGEKRQFGFQVASIASAFACRFCHSFNRPWSAVVSQSRSGASTPPGSLILA